MRRFFVVVLVAALALSPAIAEAMRQFPANARRGELTAHQYPHYQIDKKTYRLAAGGKIFSPQNLIIMPSALQAQSAEVMYQIDMNGQLSAIWLLNREEIERLPRATQAPASANSQ